MACRPTSSPRNAYVGMHKVFATFQTADHKTQFQIQILLIFNFDREDTNFAKLSTMTKLMQWILFIGLAFILWISLLVDMLPFKPCSHMKEMLWPV